MNRNIYEQYIAILEGELVPALGCTEPIAIALAAAKARQVLGEEPQKMVVSCSGNIIKNVKGVVVPNSGGLKGIDTSAVLGAGLEVYLVLSGLVDLGAERERLAKEQAKLAADAGKLEKKLSNPGFLAKAAPEIVEKDRAKHAELADKLARVEAQLAELG